MRITALSCACFLIPLLVLAADQDASPQPQALYSRIAKMASALSEGDAYRAIESLDKSVPGYHSIVEHIQALTDQTQILCRIDIVADKEADNPSADVHHLDLDWYMTLTSKADGGPVERRRIRVDVAARRIKTKSGEDWRIIELSPASIFDPIKIS